MSTASTDHQKGIISQLEAMLETEQDTRNTLADKMESNQKLATSAERLAGGFSIIYSDLEASKYRVEKLRLAIESLRAITPANAE